MTQSRRTPVVPDAAASRAAEFPDGGSYVAPHDALLRDPVMPYAVQVSVLGIPVRLRTNDRRVLAMFQATFGPGEPVPAVEDVADYTLDQTRDDRPLQLRLQVVVYDGATHDAGMSTLHHICPDPVRLIIHGDGGMAISDPLRREALIYANDGLVRDEAQFRHNFVEAATLALVTHFDRQPFHAAAIRHNGCALLLIGPSGAGKSTLAYLAHTAGLDVLSEDIVWMQLAPAPRIWGRPQAIHLLPGSEALFPELRHDLVLQQPNGKHKITVHLKHPEHAASKVANDAAVCVLRQGRGEARLARIGRDELYSALMRDVAAGFDRYAERRAECARVLAATGGWCLTLSTNPHDALPLLTDLLLQAGTWPS